MEKLANVILSLGTIALIACHSFKDSKNFPAAGFKPPKIIDTLLVAEAKVDHAVTESYPRVIAVLPFGDSCVLKKVHYRSWDNSVNHNVDKRSDGLQFLVDTSQIIAIRNTNREDNPYMGDTMQEYYRGYPCFVYNECQQLKWLLTQDERVMVIQEAMDSNYDWRPIQVWGWAWCGNSYDFTPIKPNHYLLFETPLYKGTFYTDIRLKLHTRYAVYYSNTYKGWINYGQFTVKPPFADKKGKLRTNYGFL